VQPVLICASAMMFLAAINQEFGLPAIDSFMLENRKNPDGAQETDCKGNYDFQGILISADKAVKKDGLLKNFSAIIPQRPGRNAITNLQAKEAYYLPPKENDKLSGGWLLKGTRREGH